MSFVSQNYLFENLLVDMIDLQYKRTKYYLIDKKLRLCLSGVRKKKRKKKSPVWKIW